MRELFTIAGRVSINQADLQRQLADAERAGQTFGTNFDRQLNRVGNSVDKWLRRGMMVAAATITGTAAAGVKAFAEFDEKIREVYTLLPDVSAEVRENLREEIQQLSIELGEMPVDMVDALYQALSAGIPPDNVIDFLRVAGRAAIAGATDVRTAVDGLTTIIAAYGEENMDAQRASDALFTAMRMGKTTIAELAGSIGTVVPIANMLGVEIEATTAAMATMTLGGISTAESSTYLRAMFTELSDETRGLGQVFYELTEQSFMDFIREGGNVADGLQMIRDYSEQSGQSMTQLAGRVHAAVAALILTNEESSTFNDIMGEMADNVGATDRAYAEFTENLALMTRQFRVWWQTVLIRVGEELEPVMKRILGALEENRERIGDVIVSVFKGLADSLLWIIDNADAVVRALTVIAGGLAIAWAAAHPLKAALAGLTVLITQMIVQDRNARMAILQHAEAMKELTDATGDLIGHLHDAREEMGISDRQLAHIMQHIVDVENKYLEAVRTGQMSAQEAQEGFNREMQRILAEWDGAILASKEGINRFVFETAVARGEVQTLADVWAAQGGRIVTAFGNVATAITGGADEITEATEQTTRAVEDMGVRSAVATSHMYAAYLRAGTVMDEHEKRTMTLADAERELTAVHERLTEATATLRLQGQQIPKEIEERIAALDKLIGALKEERAELIRNAATNVETAQQRLQSIRNLRVGTEEYDDAIKELAESHGILSDTLEALTEEHDELREAIADVIAEIDEFERSTGLQALEAGFMGTLEAAWEWADGIRRAGSDAERWVQGVARNIVSAVRSMYRDNLRAAEEHAAEIRRIEGQFEESRERSLERYLQRIQRELESEEERAAAIDELVAQGLITYEEAQEMKQRISDERIEWERSAEYELQKAIEAAEQAKADATEEANRRREESEKSLLQVIGQVIAQALRAVADELLALAAAEAAMAVILGLSGNVVEALRRAGKAAAYTAGAVAINLAAGAIAPRLAEGGLATGPTLAWVGEGDHREAVLPLSREVYAELAEGLLDAIEAREAVMDLNRPMRAAIADVGIGTESVSFDGMFRGATINLQDEQDIRKLAEAIHDEFRATRRGRGVV